jgi:hypothetical protein
LLIGKTGDEKNMTVMANMYGQGLYSSIDDALAGKAVSAKSPSLPAWAIVLIIMAGTAALGGVIAALARLSERRSTPPPAARIGRSSRAGGHEWSDLRVVRFA